MMNEIGEKQILKDRGKGKSMWISDVRKQRMGSRGHKITEKRGEDEEWNRREQGKEEEMEKKRKTTTCDRAAARAAGKRMGPVRSNQDGGRRLPHVEPLSHPTRRHQPTTTAIYSTHPPSSLPAPSQIRPPCPPPLRSTNEFISTCLGENYYTC